MLYDEIGIHYNRQRRADARIAAAVSTALGGASTVVNVGAGTGAYEPADRCVVAVEPSAVMIAQRPSSQACLVRAQAEALPFVDRAFDAALAVLTMHHWTDQAAGLAECARVARDRIVIFTWDPTADGFWLVRDYFPEILAYDRTVFPRLDSLAAALGEIEVRPVPIPADCADGFLGAFWRRPTAYLDPGVRSSISSFVRVKAAGSGLERLRADLMSGAWETRNSALLACPEIDLGYRLVVAQAF